MPSSSSPGLMPINASTAAWRSRRTSSGSESAKNQSVRVVWLATRLFQSSDIEPPTIFRCPRNFDTSWTCTSGSDLGGLFVLIRYVLMFECPWLRRPSLRSYCHSPSPLPSRARLVVNARHSHSLPARNISCIFLHSPSPFAPVVLLMLLHFLFLLPAISP